MQRAPRLSIFSSDEREMHAPRLPAAAAPADTESAAVESADLDPNAAFALIDRAAQAMRSVKSWSDEIEGAARALAERSRDETQKIRLQLDEAEQRVVTTESRLREVEQQRNRAERRAETAERRARETAERLSALHQAIEAAFGAELASLPGLSAAA